MSPDNPDGVQAPKRAWRTIDLQSVLRDWKVRQRLAALRGGPPVRIIWFFIALMAVAMFYQLAASPRTSADFFVTAAVAFAGLFVAVAAIFAMRPRMGPIVSLEPLGKPGLEIAAIVAIVLTLALLLAIFDSAESHLGLLATALCVLLAIFGVGRMLTARAKRRLRADPSLWRILTENVALSRRGGRVAQSAPSIVARTAAQRANPHQDVAAGRRARWWMWIWGGLAGLGAGIGQTLIRIDSDHRFSDIQSRLWDRYGTSLIVVGITAAVVGVLLKIIADHREAANARKFKLNTVPSAQYALEQDRRPAILLLRSFADDVAMNGSERFEESIAPSLRQYGPLIAIGDPKDELPELGAYRDYVDDAHWQDRIRSYIKSVEIIVMIPGQSRWIQWELSEILVGNFLHKTVFVFPPGLSLAEKEARLGATWTAFSQRAELTPVQTTNLADMVAILFFDRDAITCLVDKSIRDTRVYRYEAALQEALRKRGA